MNPTLQHNTQAGPIPVLAGENLLGKKARLVKYGRNTAGALTVLAIAAATDAAALVLVADGDAGDLVTAAPFTADSNRRVIVSGDGHAGDSLALNAGGTLSVAGAGAAAAAIAEEDFVDGQEALVRPWQHTVPAAAGGGGGE